MFIAKNVVSLISPPMLFRIAPRSIASTLNGTITKKRGVLSTKNKEESSWRFASTVVRHDKLDCDDELDRSIQQPQQQQHQQNLRNRGNMNVQKNPLNELKSVSQRFDLCDDHGCGKQDRHWTFALSIVDHDGTSFEMKKVRFSFLIFVCTFIMSSNGNLNIYYMHLYSSMLSQQAPILRTVNFQRISEKGIDFLMKNRGHASNLLFLKDQYVSFLFTHGKYEPGEKVEQWRAKGLCQPLRLKEVIDYAPEFTIVEMVASMRANKEGDSRADMELSHFEELVQEARSEYQQDQVPIMELEEAVRAWRFVPYQMEQMIGGPDQLMWNRKEWVREEDDSAEWVEPTQLMPF